MMFKIVISPRADGMFEVRTDKGGYRLCTSRDEANAYANGMAWGWKAAVSTLGDAYVIDDQTA